jgi:sec-independent protein translocase protein TatA
MLGHWEILAIFLLILLIFGGKKIPEVARGLGKGLKEFKKAKDDITDSMNDSAEDSDKPVAKAESEEKDSPEKDTNTTEKKA